MVKLFTDFDRQSRPNYPRLKPSAWVALDTGASTAGRFLEGHPDPIRAIAY
jgi:hypothetical protein